MKKLNKDLVEIADYYSNKLNEFGATPNGVDWNGEDSQFVRFQQLLKVVSYEPNHSFSVNDLGCGYAAVLDYLTENFDNYSYLGFDVSSDMVTAALSRVSGIKNARIKCSSTIDEVADYGIASGVFNVKLDNSYDDWLGYIKQSLQNLHQTSNKGFSFNCLTSYSDKDKMKDYLYYADPLEMFDFCKKTFSRNVALLHDYDLYEFTILVTK